MKLLAWISCLCFLQVALAQTPARLAARDVFVKFRERPARLDRADFPQSEKIVSVKHALPEAERAGELSKVLKLKIESERDAKSIVRELQSNPAVEWAEVRQMRYTDERGIKDRARYSLDSPPNDPFFSQQWWLEQIEAPAAWDIVEPDTSIVLAVVDDGVYFELPELANARWENHSEVNGQPGVDDDQNGYVDDFYGYDFMQNDGNPLPDPVDGSNSHGTHVSGIAAAARNNRIGIAGVAGGAKIMGVRVGQGGSIPFGYEGVIYACRNGAKVINCSWGGGSESAFEREIINYVISQGCVLVASAGNEGNNLPRYPAAIEGVLSVAASTAANTAAYFTSFGPWVKISAPGVHILSTVVDGTYGAWQGTSMAAPVVTAVCGLVFKKHPDWTGSQVMTAVCSSADPIDDINGDYAGQIGLGRVNAYRAVSNLETSRGVILDKVRFGEVVGDGDSRIEAGETAWLDVEMVNQHGSIGHLTGTLVSLLDSIEIIDPVLDYPLSIPPNGRAVSIGRMPPPIQMPAVIDRGAMLPVSIEWQDEFNRLIGRATATILLDTTYAVLESSELIFALGENGALGYHDYVRNVQVGPGFALKNDLNNALYHGTLFIGVNGKVLDNFYGDSTGSRFDWTALPDVYAQHVESSLAPQAVHTRFDDRRLPESERLHAEVDATMLAWPEIPRGYVFDLQIINRSEETWNNGFCGLIMDWDLGPASRNFGGFDEESGILYVRSELASLPMVGIAGLDQTLVSAYEISNRHELQTGGFRDQRIWQIVNAGVGGFVATPRDLSHVAGVSISEIAAGDSAHMRIAVVSGYALEEMRAVLAALRDELGATQKQPPSGDLTNTSSKISLAPNPITKGQSLSISGIAKGEATLKVYNILGQEIARLASPVGATGRLDFSLPPNVAPGLLFYRLEHAGGHDAGKLLYLP